MVLFNGGIMKKFFVVVSLIMLFSLPVWADRNENMRELIKIQNPNMNIELAEKEMVEQLFPYFKCGFILVKDDEEMLQKKIAEIINLPARVVEITTKIYSSLSDEELVELMAFYKTPLGQKLINLETIVQEELQISKNHSLEEVIPQIEVLYNDFAQAHPYLKRSQEDMGYCLRSIQNSL